MDHFYLHKEDFLKYVAAIVDVKGGHRVVVGDLDSINANISPGERLYVVPDFLTEEPVPWEEIPRVVFRAQQHMLKMRFLEALIARSNLRYHNQQAI